MKPQMLEKIKDQLVKHEGLRLRPYKCPAGKTTIGIGRNLEDRGITKSEAYYLLMNDIFAFEYDLRKNLRETYTELDENRKVVLLNMTFNMGIGNLLKFKRMIRALKHKDFDRAAREMLDSLWAQQVGVRSTELSEIMRSGEM